MANGFQGKDGQTVPLMTEEYVNSVSDRYIELYEQIAGEPFVKADTSNVLTRVQKNIETFLTAYYR